MNFFPNPEDVTVYLANAICKLITILFVIKINNKIKFSF